MRQPFEATVSWSYDSPAKGGLHRAHYPGRVANRMDFLKWTSRAAAPVSKTFSIEVANMKIAFYCRVDGQGVGFVLPDEADKLCEFFAEHQDKPALENPSGAS